MTEEQIPICEKQGMIAGQTFKVVESNPKEVWKTGYSYYLSQKSQNKPVAPLYGRFIEVDGVRKFQVFKDGSWTDANFWDFSEPVMENGQVVMGASGQPKKRPFFEQKFDYLLEFVEPVEIEYYDRNLKQVVTKALNKFYVRLSRSLAGKLKEQIDDPRNPADAKFVIEYDETKPPAERYKVKFVA